jgi:hypothetical protein
MKMKAFSVLSPPVVVLLALLAQLAVAVAASDAAPTVYITRHGEKIWALGCLNATGETKESKPQTNLSPPSTASPN